MNKRSHLQVLTNFKSILQGDQNKNK